MVPFIFAKIQLKLAIFHLIFSASNAVGGEFVPRNQLQFTSSKKGKPKILWNGFSYTHHFWKKDKDFVNQMKHWRCSSYVKTRCLAKAVMSVDGDMLFKGFHNHASNV